MSLMSLPRLGAIAAAILVPATLLHAALPTPTDAPEHGSLTGQLLIAAPTMGDPRFAHTVILMVRHDRNGALGIVINRPIGERPLASVLQALGEKGTAANKVLAGDRTADALEIGGDLAPDVAAVEIIEAGIGEMIERRGEGGLFERASGRRWLAVG